MFGLFANILGGNSWPDEEKTVNGVGSRLQSVLLPRATKSRLAFSKLVGSFLGFITAAAADGQKIYLSLIKRKLTVISGEIHV